MLKVVPLLGPEFDSLSPDEFHAYAKTIHKNMKQPEKKVAKTRKTKVKDDIDSGPKPDAKEVREAKEDAGNVQASGWQDISSNQFLIAITN